MNPSHDEIQRLLAEGWIASEGNGFVFTAKGHAALRNGKRGGVPGETSYPIDSVRARAKPSKPKKKHRKESK